MLTVAWAARFHVTQSPRFALRRVEVHGNDRRASDAVVAEHTEKRTATESNASERSAAE